MATHQWDRLKVVRTTTAEETMDVGAWLATLLKAGDAVALIGTLGAGKTTMVRGLVEALGFKGRVRSPSFTLVNQYPTDPVVHHADLYRLSDSSELIALDLPEGLEEGILLVEWADKLEGAWGDPNWKVIFEVGEDTVERVITVEHALKSDT